MTWTAKFDRTAHQTIADVTLAPGVVLELVRDAGEETWEVWAVRIDGRLYREPRDLTGEPLMPGPFQARLDQLELVSESGEVRP